MSVPKLYDAIVIGTGAGGGMAIKTLCEAGLKVCAHQRGAPARSEQGLPPPPQALGHEVSRLRRSGEARRVLRLHGQRMGRGRLGARDTIHDRARNPMDVAALLRRRRQDQFLGTVVRAHGRHRLSRGVALGRGYRLAARVPGNRAVLQPRRTHDRRREHRPEPAEQSGRRVSARLQFPLPRSHPAARAARRSACRICPTGSRS